VAVKNIHRLIVAQFLSSLHFAVPIQTFFFFAKGLSFMEIMLLESILLLGILLFEVPTGMVGDKIGRKWSMVCGSAIGLLGWIPWFLADGFTLFGLSFFLLGIAIAFQSGSDQAFIYDELRAKGKQSDMQRVMGLYGGSITLGTAVAALVGGYLAATHSLDAFYLLYQLIVIAQVTGFTVLLTARESRSTVEGDAKAHQPEPSLTLFRDGLRRLVSHRKLRRILLFSLFTMPFPFVLLAIFQPYFQEASVAPMWYGTAVFLASLLSMSAKVFAYNVEKYFGVAKGALFVAILPAFFWCAMAMIFHPVFSILLYIVNSASSAVREPIFSDYFNRHIKQRNRATVLSTISLASSLYALIMRPIIGVLADRDLRYGFVFIAGIILVATALFRITEDDVRAPL